MDKPTFYEFFAGGGMARAGLGTDWQCVFANDFDPKKASTYCANWGNGEMWVGDIHDISSDLTKLRGQADLAWASFPCQDLSLAGNGAGLAGGRSGAFWGFYDIVYGLKLERRAPRVLVIENVTGLLTSNSGRDFEEICRALKTLGYVFGALCMDAKHFLPQSRPRLFIVAILKDTYLLQANGLPEPAKAWTSMALERAHRALRPDLRSEWRWWNVPSPPESREVELIDIVQDHPNDVAWHTQAETERLISMMSAPNRTRLDAARASGERRVGTIYRRTRFDETGAKVQRAELRMDGTAGCLRTPGGGSSRQFIVLVQGEKVRSRLLSSREAAGLMGLCNDYLLPSNYNEAYHLLGDGLAVSVVRHLGVFMRATLLGANQNRMMAAE